MWEKWIQSVAVAVTIALPLGESITLGLDDDSPEQLTTAAGDPNDELLFGPPNRPSVPQPETPSPSTQKSGESDQSFLDWHHLTGDWWGLRTTLEDSGVTISLSLTSDYTRVVTGGASPDGAAFRSLLNAGLTLDTERLIDVKGGTFFCNFQNFSGDNGSEDVGVIQNISNIDGPHRTQVSELWYEQALFDNQLSFRIGKIDAASLFAYVKNGAEFLNGSIGTTPTLVGMPTYPDPATAFTLSYVPCQYFYANAGIFDGATLLGSPTGPRGPGTVFTNASERLIIAEIGAKWQLDENLPGRVGIGGWHHGGHIPRYSGGTTNGTAGAYIVADQALWRANPGDKEDSRGISAFLQFGLADREVSASMYHASVGATWTGLIPSRNEDVLGLCGTSAILSDVPEAGFAHSNETTVELFYKLQVTPFFSLKPDFQYIFNPGGAAGRDNALAFTLRSTIDF
jgi:porin